MAFALSLLSAGTPMFLMGEEIGAQQPYRYNDFLTTAKSLTRDRAGVGARALPVLPGHHRLQPESSRDPVAGDRHHPRDRDEPPDRLHPPPAPMISWSSPASATSPTPTATSSRPIPLACPTASGERSSTATPPPMAARESGISAPTFLPAAAAFKRSFRRTGCSCSKDCESTEGRTTIYVTYRMSVSNRYDPNAPGDESWLRSRMHSLELPARISRLPSKRSTPRGTWAAVDLEGIFVGWLTRARSARECIVNPRRNSLACASGSYSADAVLVCESGGEAV